MYGHMRRLCTDATLSVLLCIHHNLSSNRCASVANSRESVANSRESVANFRESIANPCESVHELPRILRESSRIRLRIVANPPRIHRESIANPCESVRESSANPCESACELLANPPRILANPPRILANPPRICVCTQLYAPSAVPLRTAPRHMCAGARRPGRRKGKYLARRM